MRARSLEASVACATPFLAVVRRLWQSVRNFGGKQRATHRMTNNKILKMRQDDKKVWD